MTGATEEEAEALGVKYLQMAQNMSVSSTEIAEAAVVYARQGLDESSIDNRLQWTIQFAKTAGIEFEDASSLVTATVNAMEVSAEKAVDIFTYLG